MSAAASIQSDRNCQINLASAVSGRLLRDESGQDLIEYALVFALVALGAVASMKSLGTMIATVVAAVGTNLTGAV